MSAEDRRKAVWEIYRDDLPQDVLEKADRVLARQAREKARLETFDRERQAILQDPNLSFEERQELLLEISERYNTTPFP